MRYTWAMLKYFVVATLFWGTVFLAYAYHLGRDSGTPIGVVHTDPANPSRQVDIER